MVRKRKEEALSQEAVITEFTTRAELRKMKEQVGKKKRHTLRWFLLSVLVFLLLGGGYLYNEFNTALHGGYNMVTKKAADGSEIKVPSDVLRAPREVFHGETSINGANNILLLGTDQRADEASSDSRSDSIMILQLDGPSGKPKLLSIMRDTLVEVPGVAGYQKINSAFAIGEQNNHQGAELLRQTIKENFDIDCKYYASVDFSSFAQVVDSLFPNGVKIDAKFATVDGQNVTSVEVPDDLAQVPGENVPLQTIHVGEQRMNGQTLLNYARFRHDDENDFGRVKRQQQVISVLKEQVQNPAILLNAPKAIGQVLSFTSTDVPNDFITGQVWNVVMGSSGANLETMTIPNSDDYTSYYDESIGSALQITDAQALEHQINEFLGQ